MDSEGALYPYDRCRTEIGPSLKLHPNEYRERYGDEISLVQVQDVEIELRITGIV